MSDILVLDGLHKHFRSHWTFRQKNAIQDVSLRVREGEIFGFLGHNGAGKTTTMKCVLGLLRKTSGQVFFQGQPLESYKQREGIGYLPELPYFYDHLSTEETLKFFAALYGLKGSDLKSRVNYALEKVSLTERRRDKVRTLSKGLQQRLAFAQAILNRPKLLLLDEPFSGLDPNGRADLRKLILEMHDLGSTIFLSSHILPDIQDMCDRVAIMAYGRLRRELDLEELTNPMEKTFLLNIREQPAWSAARQIIEARAVSLRVDKRTSGDIFELEFADYAALTFALNEAISRGVVVERFGPREKHLEEIFLEVLQEGKALGATA